jgi:predicted MFS family arabinose efflux permease
MHGKTLVFAMALGQVGGLLPHVAVPSVMPQFLIPEWGLSNSEAGLMASAYALGYMALVPFLTTLTDRIDARLVLLGSSLISALATIGFGLWADGLISAMVFWCIAGMGFGGSYMPGLKALTDRLGGADSSRSIVFYTASFSFGVGLSFLACQALAEWWGWRASFVITGAAPLIMTTVALVLRPVRPPPREGKFLEIRPALRNKAALGYSLAYGAHCFELYGIRTWIVAFWGFVAARGDAPVTAIAVSTIFTLIAMPASMLGNELALKIGRHRAATIVMLLSAVVGLVIGLTAGLSPWLSLALMVVYAFTTPGDSGALTAGMTAAANPHYRGATMAVHSTIGFAFTAAGGWAFGIALDAAGGTSAAAAWALAFGIMSVAVTLGPVALWWSRRGERLAR